MPSHPSVERWEGRLAKMLKIGDIIKTNYNGEGAPYRVISIKRGCICPSYLDWISMRQPPEREEHIHITCVPNNVLIGSEREGDLRWLNGYVEREDGRILSLGTDWEGTPDEIFILGYQAQAQMSLF